ncbi:MAG: two-component regulator propeller domain-containing protein [Saprospiraceae bacterium]|nr:hypothetical protein [Lewinella sp.]
MNSSHYFPYLLYLVVITTSCRGQQPADRPEKTPLIPTVINTQDVDPYFVASEAITTPYGPTSITRTIIEDSKGNIWLATWQGIIRYDGKTFTNFTSKDNLRKFHAFSVLEDRKGNIWFATIGAGVYRYDGQSFVNYTSKEGLANDRVIYIYEDTAGNIWFGGEGGISCFDGKSFRNYTTEEGLTSNDVNTIIEDKTGKFWIGTRGQACTFDGKTFTVLTNPFGKPFENVRLIMEDSRGHIWLGGNDGLWRYDGMLFTNYSTHFVGYIYEDHKGNIWTSSEGINSRNWVLSRYDTGGTTATQIRSEEGMYFGIAEDREGGIWVGTLNGVCRYDGTSFNYFRDEKTRD